MKKTVSKLWIALGKIEGTWSQNIQQMLLWVFLFQTAWLAPSQMCQKVQLLADRGPWLDLQVSQHMMPCQVSPIKSWKLSQCSTLSPSWIRISLIPPSPLWITWRIIVYFQNNPSNWCNQLKNVSMIVSPKWKLPYFLKTRIISQWVSNSFSWV